MQLEPWLGAAAAVALTAVGGAWTVLTGRSVDRAEQRGPEWIAATSAAASRRAAIPR